MKEKLMVKSSPHISSNRSTSKIMLNVILALLPCILASVLLFGLKSLRIMAYCALFSMLFEIVFSLFAKRQVLIEDFSAVLSGILLGLCLPVNISIYPCLIGSMASIIVAKQLFGGIGQNFVNPALFGRAIMLICFPKDMTDWRTNKGIVDLTSGATPLEIIYSGNIEQLPSLKDLLLGMRGGCIGETCILAILLGLLYLCITKVITPVVPVSFIGGALLTSILIGAGYREIFCGGLFFSAVFMATDYVTSPISNLGKTIFGLGCGVLTIVLRKFASAPEGVTTAILFMNLLVPYINRYTLAQPFGTGKKAIQNV